MKTYNKEDILRSEMSSKGYLEFVHSRDPAANTFRFSRYVPGKADTPRKEESACARRCLLLLIGVEGKQPKSVNDCLALFDARSLLLMSSLSWKPSNFCRVHGFHYI